MFEAYQEVIIKGFDTYELDKLTDEHKHRLNLLAVYLYNLGDDYPKFEMMDYLAKFDKNGDRLYSSDDRIFNNKNPEAVYKKQYNQCGTAACAVGHAPSLGHINKTFKIQKLKTPIRDFHNGDYYKRFTEDWNDYCERVFGLEPDTDAWDYLFGSEWHEWDNTPTGAAKRIMYFLKRGVPSEAFEDTVKKYNRCKVA
jgi:hypothetical protein